MVSASTVRPTRESLAAQGLRWYCARRWIIDGVDLVVNAGEIVGLLGPNGAGKTVTMSMMVGLTRPSSGRVLIGADDVTKLALHERARRGLGYLPQERSIFTGLTARDNIKAILETRGLSRWATRHRTDELLAQFGLTHVADTRAARLSGGEQRRLEVARSLATEPKFLLVDEPFAGIDPITIESLHRIFDELRELGVGILLTDHNVVETLALCDRAYVLVGGRVLADGTPMALVENAAVHEHFLGDALDEPAAQTFVRRNARLPAAMMPPIVTANTPRSSTSAR